MADPTEMFSYSSTSIGRMREAFGAFAKEGLIAANQLGQVMEQCGETVPPFKLRQIEGDFQTINFSKFLKLFSKLSTRTVGGQLRKAFDKREDVKETEVSEVAAKGTKHSLSGDEQVGLSDFLDYLENDPDLKG